MTGKTEWRLKQRKRAKREEEIKRALEFCRANRCRGTKAILTGRFPLIKHASLLNRRLDGIVTQKGIDRERLRILTVKEEELLVRYK